MSLERAIDIDAEWLIGLDFDGSLQSTLDAIPTVAAIPAVRGGRFRVVGPEDSWAIASSSVLTRPLVIETLHNIFAGS